MTADSNNDILIDVDYRFMDVDTDINYFNDIRPVIPQYFTVEQFNLLEDGSTTGLTLLNQNIHSVYANFDASVVLLDAFLSHPDIIALTGK